MVFYTDAEFVPDCSIGYLARRVHQLSSAGLEPVFEGEGITLTQWSALATILCGRGNTAAELARDLAYDKGATTRLVDTLVERGWVERARDAGDRRQINLALTAAGSDVARRCRDKVVGCWNDWLADWEQDEAAMLMRLLQRLRDTLRTAVEQGGCA